MTWVSPCPYASSVTGDENLFSATDQFSGLQLRVSREKHTGKVINRIADCDSVVVSAETAGRRRLLTLSVEKPR